MRPALVPVGERLSWLLSVGFLSFWARMMFNASETPIFGASHIYNKPHGAQSFTDNGRLTSRKKSTPCVEQTCTLPCSQQPANGPYPVSDKPSPCSHDHLDACFILPCTSYCYCLSGGRVSYKASHTLRPLPIYCAPILNSNNSGFTHQSCLAVTGRHLVAKEEKLDKKCPWMLLTSISFIL
jgi:hypothetical protein